MTPRPVLTPGRTAGNDLGGDFDGNDLSGAIWSHPMAVPAEHDVEASLRPRTLDDFVGQPKVREQLELVLASAKLRGRAPDHVLLSGPARTRQDEPGHDHRRPSSGAPIRITSGPAIERAGDLAALLTSLTDGEVLFIDEIHRIARPAEELLYMAMEDFRVDVIVGKGPGIHRDPARSGSRSHWSAPPPGRGG